jgi:hypothetical protein
MECESAIDRLFLKWLGIESEETVFANSPTHELEAVIAAIKARELMVNRYLCSCFAHSGVYRERNR